MLLVCGVQRSNSDNRWRCKPFQVLPYYNFSTLLDERYEHRRRRYQPLPLSFHSTLWLFGKKFCVRSVGKQRKFHNQLSHYNEGNVQFSLLPACQVERSIQFIIQWQNWPDQTFFFIGIMLRWKISCHFDRCSSSPPAGIECKTGEYRTCMYAVPQEWREATILWDMQELEVL